MNAARRASTVNRFSIPCASTPCADFIASSKIFCVHVTTPSGKWNRMPRIVQSALLDDGEEKKHVASVMHKKRRASYSEPLVPAPFCQRFAHLWRNHGSLKTSYTLWSAYTCPIAHATCILLGIQHSVCVFFYGDRNAENHFIEIMGPKKTQKPFSELPSSTKTVPDRIRRHRSLQTLVRDPYRHARAHNILLWRQKRRNPLLRNYGREKNAKQIFEIDVINQNSFWSNSGTQKCPNIGWGPIFPCSGLIISVRVLLFGDATADNPFIEFIGKKNTPEIQKRKDHKKWVRVYKNTGKKPNLGVYLSHWETTQSLNDNYTYMCIYTYVFV